MNAEEFEERTKNFSEDIENILNQTLDSESANVCSKIQGVEVSTITVTKDLGSVHCPYKRFGVLDGRFSCGVSSSGKYFAIEKSSISVKIGYGETARPILRVDYDRRDTSYIGCHAHVVGANSLFDYLAPRIGKNKSKKRHFLPQTTDVLHIPVGGKRFRPGIEDIIELLITQCGVSHKDGALDIINESRKDWTATQTRAVVTDNPEEAIKALKDLGYSIEKTSTNSM